MMNDDVWDDEPSTPQAYRETLIRRAGRALSEVEGGIMVLRRVAWISLAFFALALILGFTTHMGFFQLGNGNSFGFNDGSPGNWDLELVGPSVHYAIGSSSFWLLIFVIARGLVAILENADASRILDELELLDEADQGDEDESH